MNQSTGGGDTVVLDVHGLGRLLDLLALDGYQLIGPTVRDGAIVLAEVHGLGDLPAGWTDEQDAGSYRLRRRTDDAYFGHVVGPHSWKQFLLPPRSKLFEAARSEDGSLVVQSPQDPVPVRRAFLGVRSCDLHAIGVQDRVFLDGQYPDATYAAGREAFIVAVNCGQAGGTCFCVSMGTGPRAERGFDLVLTEMLDDRRHDFLLESGSLRGRSFLDRLEGREADTADREAADAAVARAAAAMGRQLDTAGLREALVDAREHPRWDDVARRCLACTNCTMVCPTCFCTTVEDVTDIKGERAERWRRWDSCFNLDFSYIHGGSVRTSTRARYRQWLTHKLSTWFDQFGVSGCVGCGRCIAWCPAAIDITREAAALREPGRPQSSSGEHRS